MKEFDEEQYPFQPKVFRLQLDRDFTKLEDKALYVATDLHAINFLRGFLSKEDLTLKINFNKSKQLAFCQLYQREQQCFALFNQAIDPTCQHSFYQQFTQKVCRPKRIAIIESVHSNILTQGVFALSNSFNTLRRQFSQLPQSHVIKGISGLFLIKSEMARTECQYILFSFDSEENRSNQLISLFKHLGKGNLKPLRPVNAHLYI